ncbi:hypothetical protein DSL72_001765 [Monilinia vaccinii-corymbosi]|uniref:Uncharacterized protein n=1 Tax=Monilinia vaccinii-corymbosi TaxID=61207 RepID=A0A8A3PAS4_9HELO|nr:hypothetical protein DSL72_001765 [Monilinia vaccinii-corymbosi]
MSSPNTPCPPKNRALTCSSPASPTTSTSFVGSRRRYQATPKPLTLARSPSASSLSSLTSPLSLPSSPLPFAEPMPMPPLDSRHSNESESVYRRMKMPDSPKPHYFYERPGFFTPKRLAPKAPWSRRAKILFIGGEGPDFGEGYDE